MREAKSKAVYEQLYLNLIDVKVNPTAPFVVVRHDSGEDGRF